MKETLMQDIELHKENIMPLPQGRSAAALMQVLNQDTKVNNSPEEERNLKELELQKRIQNVSEDDDDPLEPFVTYVNWIRDNYPSGKPSQLMKVVEKCVRMFKGDVRYKNDPRFLKIWLIVAHNGKEPVEVFKYLSVNKIGADLALYYEEYAKLLEKISRNKEAFEVYQIGIARKASPLERLNRNYLEFQKRMDFASNSQEHPRGSSSTDSQARATTVKPSKSSSQKKTGLSVSKSKDRKFEVFCDEDSDEKIRPDDVLPSVESANDWVDYVPEAIRKKENTKEPTPWTGVTLPQKTLTGTRSDDFTVFKDEEDTHTQDHNPNDVDEKEKLETLASNASSSTTASGKETKDKIESKPKNIAPKKRKEILVCNLKELYQGDQEFSPEELRCMKTGFCFDALRAPHKQKSISPPPKSQGHAPSPTINTKEAMKDIFDMFNQPIADTVWEDEDETISAKVYKPEAFKIGVFKDEDDNEEELISTFDPAKNLEHNQFHPSKTPKALPTYPIQSTPLYNSSMGQATPCANLRPQLRSFDIMTPITEVSEDRTFAGLSTIKSDKNITTALSSISCEDSTGSMKSFLLRSQSGIVQSNALLEQLGRDLDDLEVAEKIDSADHETEVLESKDFESKSCQDENNNDTLQEMEIPNPCNPRDPLIIKTILSSVQIPNNCGFYSFSTIDGNFSQKVKTIISSKKSNTKNGEYNTAIELPEIGCLKLIKKLGEGSYGTVFLVRQKNLETYGFGEDEDEEYSRDAASYAMKITVPPSPWDFYVLSVLRARLSTSRITSSIIKPISCHLYRDESILLMEYADQGSLLNCVNMAQKGGYGSSTGHAGLDELLAIFWTIEVLKIIETVHATGLMHGDIKPDNFLIRLKDCPDDVEWTSTYETNGDDGWGCKGLYLVDWGSAIDLLSFPEDFKFLIDRKGADPDPSIECWELRNNQPWTYELDWYGVAGVIHILLFGTYMQVIETPVEGKTKPHISITSHFKRYWHSELWKSLFEILLNVGTINTEMLHSATEDETITIADQSLLGPGTDFEVLQQDFPAIRLIHEKRLEMEMWLKENCCKSGKSLKNLLRRVEITVLETLS